MDWHSSAAISSASRDSPHPASAITQHSNILLHAEDDLLTRHSCMDATQNKDICGLGNVLLQDSLQCWVLKIPAQSEQAEKSGLCSSREVEHPGTHHSLDKTPFVAQAPKTPVEYLSSQYSRRLYINACQDARWQRQGTPRRRSWCSLFDRLCVQPSATTSGVFNPQQDQISVLAPKPSKTTPSTSI